MTVFGKNLLAAHLVVVVAASAACSTKSPTSPTDPVVVQPSIQSLAPASPVTSNSTQTITVTGTNFSSGLSLILKGPDTGAITYGPSAISQQTATSFKATVTIAAAGNWTATVRSSDGVDSTQYPFTATAPAATNPQILSVGPSALVFGNDAQTLHVTGVNFRSGLSLMVRSSLGVTTTYNGASITAQTATSFDAQVALSTFGIYQLTVHNADGLESGPFNLIVNPRPVVTAVSPTLTASTSTQIITVTGLHFETGLSYVLKGPDTGGVTHGNADVTNFTTTSFNAVGVFATPGGWSITVINANGVVAAEFPFTIGS